MKSKKTVAIIVTLSMGVLVSFAAMANDSTPAQNNIKTFGNAMLIPSDDYLLDGNYSNGELVNGSIYHSESEAAVGVQNDKREAMRNRGAVMPETPEPELRVYPNTGIVEGISSKGAFYYNIKSPLK